MKGARPDRRVSAWELLQIWSVLSVQSFGGGSATLFLIHRAFVHERGWMSSEELTEGLAKCQIVPGINLVALTILIGSRLGGPIGAAVSVVGLLLPSVGITVLMTAAFTEVRDLPQAQAALRGVVPAAAGLGVLLSMQMALPLLQASRREGRGSLVLSGALLVGSGAVVLILNPPVVLILLAVGGIAAVAARSRAQRGTEVPKTGAALDDAAHPRSGSAEDESHIGPTRSSGSDSQDDRWTR